MLFVFLRNIWAKTVFHKFSKFLVVVIASLLEIWKFANSHWINVPIRLIELIGYVFVSPSDYNNGLYICSQFFHVYSAWKKNRLNWRVIKIINQFYIWQKLWTWNFDWILSVGQIVASTSIYLIIVDPLVHPDHGREKLV